jgi:hypothetical protein
MEWVTPKPNCSSTGNGSSNLIQQSGQFFCLSLPAVARDETTDIY